MPHVEHWTGLVADLVRGRDVILAQGAIASMTGAVERLSALGAGRFFLIGDTVGTGALPEPEAATWRVVGGAASDVLGAVRGYEAALGALPPDVVAELDAWDPERAALVLVTFVADVDLVGGRARYAPRPPAWIALEDKTIIDARWDAWRVHRAPSATAPVAIEAVAAAARLDRGEGTVWSGDAREGFNGGAAYVRWVRTPAEVTAALAFFDARCAQVRVAPFLEGVPCSIHGVVFDETVITFRPAEMIVLRRPEAPHFLYAGAATYWDPPERDRAEMRAVARRVGGALRAEVGYRGPFTVDGILTAEGFLPTELNPRFGAAMGLLTAGAPGLPFGLLCDRVRNGDALDYRPAALEAVVTDLADAHRGGGAWAVLDQPRDGTVGVDLVWTGRTYRQALGGEPPHGRLIWGPSAVGSFVRFSPEPAHTPHGPPLALRAVQAFAAADRILGTTFGPLSAAAQVRR